MEKITTVEFDQKVSPRVALEAVVGRGACAVHNFASPHELQAAAEIVRSEKMMLDENLSANVKRRQHMGAFAMDASNVPYGIATLATQVKQYVTQNGFQWTPNEIITHRYEKNDFIGRHRDYKEAYGLVAVLTLDGAQDFYVELDGNEEPSKIALRPGTLTMLRGFTGDPNKRPYHWVEEATAERTALSIRDMRSVWTEPDVWS